MMPLVRRVATERRAIVLPLAIVILVNILVYAFVVYPLGVKSTGSAEKAAAAAVSRRAAERDEAAARALVTGKAKADEELASFYDKVLPGRSDGGEAHDVCADSGAGAQNQRHLPAEPFRSAGKE